MQKTKGESKTRLYRLYYGMLSRCNNPKTPNYRIYGGRGIKVCKEWENNFYEFKEWSLNNGYADDLSIDRIDVNGNYEPSNCRWVTNLDQARNRRNTVHIDVNGITKTAKEWSEDAQTCVSKSTILNRYHKGVKGKRLLEQGFRRTVVYKGEEVTLEKLSMLTGLNYNTISTRYTKGFRGKKLWASKEDLSPGKEVIQYDKNMNELARFKSCSEAGRTLGICKSRIIECCNGTAKTSGGYIWKYA